MVKILEVNNNTNNEINRSTDISNDESDVSIAERYYTAMEQLSEIDKKSLIEQLSDDKYQEWKETHNGTYADFQRFTFERFNSNPEDEYEESDINEKVSNYLEKSGVVRNADLRGFDCDFSLELQKAFDDAKADFPDLEISYCGTIQNQVEGIRNRIAEKYEAKLKELNGDNYSEDYYKKIASDYADRIISKYGLEDTDGVFAWSMHLPEKTYEKYNGIGINEIYSSDNDLFSEVKIEEVCAKHKPIGCDTPRATVDHELGHEIDKLVGASDDEYIVSLYEEMMENGNAKEVLSDYSQTSVSEFIAEAYSEYRNNPNPREYAVKVYERLVELYGERSKCDE